MQSIFGGAIEIHAFDPTGGFNDPNIGGFYSFKVEEVIQGRIPTIHNAIVTYRDLGQVQSVWTLSGINDALLENTKQGVIINQQVAVSKTVTVNWGNSNPTGLLMTCKIDLNLTAMNLQLTITRHPGMGPLSIAKVVLAGRVEAQQRF